MNFKTNFFAFLIMVLGLSSIAQEKNTLKLAMAQMLVEGGKKQQNLERATARIEEAAEKNADIILLPEAMDLGWTHSSAKTKASPIPEGDSFQTLSKAAQENNIFVCAGIIEKDDGKIYNSAVLINRSGELILKHRKINELDIAHDLYQLGDAVNVCDTEFGRIGLLICADATAKDFVLTRTLGYLGADLILLPSSWAVKPDHDNKIEPYGGMWKNAFSSVCKEFNLDLAAVSNVGEVSDGPWENWKCIGNSMFMESGGRSSSVLPHGVSSDTILYKNVQLTKRPGKGTTWHNYWESIK